MPNWAGYAYTKKGRALQAKVEAGAILEITKVVLGDGGIPADIENMNDLVSPKLEAPIVDIAVNGTTCTISVLVSNIGLQSSIYPSEAGIFAKDPDLGEILLLYIRDSNPDYLPVEGSAVVVSEKLNFHIGFSIAPEVSIQLNPTGLMTVEMLMEHEKINRIWQQSQGVEVGDVRYPKVLSSASYLLLECTAAGTTGTIEPTWGAIGSTVTDGTAQWVVCDVRQNTPGGRVVTTADFTQSLTSSGWSKSPGGLITLWGTSGALTFGKTLAVTLPVAVNQILSVTLSITGEGISTSNRKIVPKPGLFTQTSFTLFSHGVSGDDEVSARWTALAR